jgi:MSHA biogenesis protein MshI
MWAKLQSFWSKKKSQRKIAALHWKQDSFNTIILEQSSPQSIVSQSMRQPFVMEQWPQALKSLLSKMPDIDELVLVLAPEHYQLVQLDKPAVPASELTSALRWQLKELVAIPVDDMQIDFLDLPTSHQQQQARLQVVVSSKKLLQRMVGLLNKNHIRIDSIVPEEWVLKSLVPVQNYPILFLSHQPGQDASIMIVRSGQVCFSRRIRGMQQLHQYSLEELKQGLLDNLGLEVQRSVDYFEGQLKQATVRHLVLALDSDAQGPIADFFRQLGFTQVEELNLSSWLPDLTNKEQAEFALPLAAALEKLSGSMQESQLENAS